MQQFIIGLRHPESIQIPPKHNAVSGQHARISILDNGDWILEDMGSTNGTYVVDADGQLRPVSQMRITPSTTIQLGPPTVNGYRFTASFVNKDLDPAWQSLQSNYMLFKQQESKLKSRTKTIGWIQKLGGILALFPVLFLTGLIKDTDGSNLMLIRMGSMAVVPAIVGFICDFALRDREKVINRRKGLVCPNPACQRPLSDHDIEYGACPFCKSYRKY